MAAMSEFHGIPDQVQQDLTETRRITHNELGDIGICGQNQFDTLGRGLHRKGIDHAFCQPSNIKGDFFQFDLTALETREIQNITDQRDEGFCA